MSEGMERVKIGRMKDMRDVFGSNIPMVGYCECETWHVSEDVNGNLHVLRKNPATGNWKLPETIIRPV